MNDAPVGLILGGAGGIGAATAQRLAGRGWTVLVTGRDPARLDAVRQACGAVPIACDVLETGAIERVVEQVTANHGRLDGVANCVGSVLLKPAHLTSDEEWEHTLALNATSSFRLVRAAAGWMSRHGGGSIVLSSSVAAARGLVNHEAIAAAKAAVEGLARAAAATYARQNVRVNAVAPGLVKTALTRRLWEAEAMRKASEAMHPLGRLGEPGQVASAIAWLLDPEQSWITGQVLGIDGGLGTLQAR